MRNARLDIGGHLRAYLVRSPKDPEPRLVLEVTTVPGRDLCGQLLRPLVCRCDRQFGVGRELDLARISSRVLLGKAFLDRRDPFRAESR